MANVFDVAAYIIQKKKKVTAMKLQKLVYYSQAWSLVWDEKPLFGEKTEAWSNGPVVRELYDAHRGQYYVHDLPGNPDNLDIESKETIDIVFNYYGDKSSQYLSDLTHMEEPWKEARKGLADSERSNQEITMASMEEFYGSLPPEN